MKKSLLKMDKEMMKHCRQNQQNVLFGRKKNTEYGTHPEKGYFLETRKVCGTKTSLRSKFKKGK